MNKTLTESVDTFLRIMEKENQYSHIDLLILPNNVSLAFLAQLRGEDSHISLGVQNIYFEDSGAFTGEIGIKQVEEYVQYALVGHSERRNLFGETDELVSKKLFSVLEKSNITPILCIGDNIEVKKGGKVQEYLSNQLTIALKGVKDIKNMVIAYEPYWAISDKDGIKIIPTTEIIAEVASFIRKFFKERYNEEVSKNLLIIYGGSVHEGNVEKVMNIEGINGALIGAASLEFESLDKIIGKIL